MTSPALPPITVELGPGRSLARNARGAWTYTAPPVLARDSGVAWSLPVTPHEARAHLQQAAWACAADIRARRFRDGRDTEVRDLQARHAAFMALIDTLPAGGEP